MDKTNEMTECLVCSSVFTDPRQLPCIHTFCLQCLNEIAAKAEAKPGDTIPCPFCRKEFSIPTEGMTGLPQNLFMNRMAEVARISKPSDKSILCEICVHDRDEDEAIHLPTAAHYCIQCRKNICNQCSGEHMNSKEFHDHRVVLLGSPLTEDLVQDMAVHFCEQHGKEVKLYCSNCRQVICTTCAAEEHEAHDTRDIETAADGFREDLVKGLGQLNVCSQEAQASLQKIVENQLNFQKSAEVTEEAVIRRGNQLKEIVDQCTTFLLDQLETLRQQELNRVDN